jgi:hypothetical protein
VRHGVSELETVLPLQLLAALRLDAITPTVGVTPAVPAQPIRERHLGVVARQEDTQVSRESVGVSEFVAALASPAEVDRGVLLLRRLYERVHQRVIEFQLLVVVAGACGDLDVIELLGRAHLLPFLLRTGLPDLHVACDARTFAQDFDSHVFSLVISVTIA